MAEQLLTIRGVAELLATSVSVAWKTLQELGVSVALDLGPGRGRGPRWWHHEIVAAIESKRTGQPAPAQAPRLPVRPPIPQVPKGFWQWPVKEQVAHIRGEHPSQLAAGAKKSKRKQ